MCNSLDSEILVFDKPLPKRNAKERKWATLKSTYIGHCEKYMACNCIARFVSDQVGNQNVGFLMMRPYYVVGIRENLVTAYAMRRF